MTDIPKGLPDDLHQIWEYTLSGVGSNLRDFNAALTRLAASELARQTAERERDRLTEINTVARQANEHLVQRIAELERLQPKWTTETPTVEGWYWHRRTGNQKTVLCVWVSDSGNVLCIENGAFLAERGEWCGPLVPPGDAV